MIETWYRRAGKTSIAAVIFLILVGGIVRSTGAGMGCPDWPKCFGMWVPPTEESQLPPGWRETYGKHGYADAPFNPVKTWTEYINRLVGVSVGFCLLIVTALSVQMRKKDMRIPLFSFAALFVTGFEGWLGAKVVELNLAGWMVTVHMFFAFIILALLAAALVFSEGDTKRNDEKLPGWVKIAGALSIVLVLVQVLIGTQVREAVDEVALSLQFQQRNEWLNRIPAWFPVHRITYLAASAGVAAFAIGLIRNSAQRSLAGWLMLAVVAAEVLAGILLVQMDLPPWLQPIHLVLACILFHLQFFTFAAIMRSKNTFQSRQQPATFAGSEIHS